MYSTQPMYEILTHVSYFHSSLPELATIYIMQLSLLKGTPLEYTISADHPLINTPLGNVQIGSILSYHIHVYKNYIKY